MSINKPDARTTAVGWLSVFASTGTLICCAIPIVVVSLGFGTVVAALTSQFPVLVVLSELKGWLFLGSAILLIVTAWLIWGRKYACPADPEMARRCEALRRWNKRVFWGASAIWGVGFITAFLLLPMRNLLDV